MQVPTSAQVTPPTVTVNNGVTVARGFSTEVRSDLPPVQQTEGVRYTRGRPSDDETYVGLYSPRKRSAPKENPDAALSTSEKKEVAETDRGKRGPFQDVSERDADARNPSDLSDSRNPLTLTEEDRALLEQLQKRDREVRLHEMAHQSVGGQYAGSASYEYRRGPDGKNYAVGGEVGVDIAPAATPEDTIQKARQVKAAALAPANPSDQDRQVARQAEQLITDAQSELRLQAQTAENSAQEQSDDSADAPEANQRPGEQSSADSMGGADSLEANEDKPPAQTLKNQTDVIGYLRPDAPTNERSLLNLII